MKSHNIDDAQLQAAIDEACQEVANGPHRPICAELSLKDVNTSDWSNESLARRALAKAFLARLPEPVPTTMNFTPFTGEELAVIKSLMVSQELDATQILRQALRHYQMAVQGQPMPPPVVDGKTPGQVAWEAMDKFHQNGISWAWIQDQPHLVQKWEATASAVLAAFGGASPKVTIQTLSSDRLQDVYFANASMGYAELPHDHAEALQAVAEAVTEAAIARMESVPCEELEKAYWNGQGVVGSVTACERIRDRLIATARGQGEAVSQPATFDAHGQTWTRHTPGDPMPCDGEAMVSVITRGEISVTTRGEFNQHFFNNTPQKSITWTWGKMDGYSHDEIVGWRYADDHTPEPVPTWQPAVGDVVTLKSGGPKMAVCQIQGTVCKCQWFRGDEADVECFEIATLQPA